MKKNEVYTALWALGTGCILMLFGQITKRFFAEEQKVKEIKIEKVEMPSAFVLVAKGDLQSGTKIDNKIVKWAKWPTESLSDQYCSIDKNKKSLTKVSWTSIVGKYLKNPLFDGTPITPNLLTENFSIGALSTSLNSGFKAVTFKVESSSLPNSLISPGDVTDIYGKDSLGNRVYFYNLRVLAVNGEVEKINQTNNRNVFASSGQQQTISVEMPEDYVSKAMTIITYPVVVSIHSIRDTDLKPRLEVLEANKFKNTNEPAKAPSITETEGINVLNANGGNKNSNETFVMGGVPNLAAPELSSKETGEKEKKSGFLGSLFSFGKKDEPEINQEEITPKIPNPSEEEEEDDDQEDIKPLESIQKTVTLYQGSNRQEFVVNLKEKQNDE